MDLGAWVLGGLLFVWQIPHFLALSWGYKNDYANAGYASSPLFFLSDILVVFCFGFSLLSSVVYGLIHY